MLRVTLFLLSILISQAAFAVTTTVEGFLIDPISLLDEQGKFQSELPRKDAPSKPIPVLQYNDSLDIVQVELSGKKVWMDAADVRLNPGKLVKLPCQQVPVSNLPDKHNASTLGYGAGCNQP